MNKDFENICLLKTWMLNELVLGTSIDDFRIKVDKWKAKLGIVNFQFRKLSKKELHILGFLYLGPDIMLFPVWTYHFLPKGIKLWNAQKGVFESIRKDYRDPNSKNYVSPTEQMFHCICIGIKV